MNEYEITFIVRPDLDEEQTKAAIRQVTGRVESTGGEIIASYPWSPARRRMAYPIRDFGDGFYMTATFRLDPQRVREMETALRLNENILRFLVVQATEQGIRQSQQRMQQAAAAAAPRPAPAPSPAEPAPQPVAPGEAGPQPAAPTTDVAPGPIPADVAAAGDVVVQDIATEPGPEPIGTSAPGAPAPVVEE